MNKNKQSLKVIVLVISAITILFSLSYAFINVMLRGEKKLVIQAGSLELILDEDSNNLTVENAFPIADEVGMIQAAFTFRLVNQDDMPFYYTIKLIDITTGEKLDTSIVKYGLTKENVDTIDFLSNLENGQVDSGIILGRESISYALRLWIDFNVEDNDLIRGKSLSYKIDVDVRLLEERERMYTLDPNGGELDTTSVSVVIGEKYGKLPEPTRLGYQFVGWQEENGSLIQSDTYVRYLEQTLTAKWEIGKYQLTFNPDGGSVDVSSKIVTYNETYGELPIPTKKGYNFLEWQIDGAKIEKNSVVTISSNQTATATWSPKEICFTYDGYSKSKCVLYDYNYGYGSDLFIPIKNGYTFQGWYTAPTGGVKIENSTPVTIDVDHNLYPRWIVLAKDKLFSNGNLGTNCATYNDGVDTFLVGKCENNYVWYSGKLWRTVLKNNTTGEVKLVADNALTIIPYNSSNMVSFANSYVDQWLQQEFLPTLHNYQNYLVLNSAWNATSNSSDKPSRPGNTTVVNRTVGLLNTYEYYTTYNQSSGLATFATTYLNTGVTSWTITPSNSSNLRTIRHDGVFANYTTLSSLSVCPAINLQSSVELLDSGDGSISSPYKLVGDSQTTINGTTLLSTRYSGEYIQFNNTRYRIVGVENGLTKITALDKPAELATAKFHTSNGIVNFGNSSMKTTLQNYYTNNISEPYKSMIETNTTWYLGTVGEGVSYKAGICATVNSSTSARDCTRTSTTATATIGLPRIGEMFASLITRDEKANFWTLTPFDTSHVRNMYNDLVVSTALPTTATGARPTMYLKSSVRIARNNTGDGTYEKPYAIELAS